MEKFNTRVPISRTFHVLCAVALALTLAACSAIKLTYNNGDTLAYWWLDGYVDLDSEQSRWVKKDIEDLFRWHRQTQLRDYAQLLATAQRQLAGNPTQADLAADFRDIRARSELLAFKALPELVDLARSMKPDQIAQMEKKFADNNEKYRKKFLRGDLESRQKQRFEKTMEQFNLWFGSFSRDQEAVLRKASDARPLNNEMWLEERILRQRRIIAVLRKIQQEKLGKDATMTVLHGLIRDIFSRFDSPERKAFYDGQIDGTINMILTAVKIATPAQKAHAQKRMQGWIDDFNTLAADKR
ncbi:MAG: DUF6279 family lipoprotein [Gammaproteobacteria bacterium]